MVLRNIEWGIAGGGDAWVYDLLEATEVSSLTRLKSLILSNF